MPIDRRHVLEGLASFFLAAPGLVAAAGCTTSVLSPERQKAAILLPLTGRGAAIGQNMERAARLISPKNDSFIDLAVYDTGSEDSGASKAASDALQGGAKIVLGPVFRTETAAAAAAVNGRVPLVAFTNDTSQAASGAFIFGLTPDQSVAAILGYAKAKGIKSIAVVTQAGEVSRQAAEAAQRIAVQQGIRVTAVVAGGQGQLMQKIRTSSGGSLPAAVLLPGGGESMIRDAEAIGGSNVKLLGTEQWLGSDLGSRPAFQDAWFAAPVASGAFSQKLASQTSTAPGILAGLAYDAVNMARVLAAAGTMTVAGVTRPEGFNGALGTFSFRADRTCDRVMSILTVENGGERVIATSQKV